MTQQELQYHSEQTKDVLAMLGAVLDEYLYQHIGDTIPATPKGWQPRFDVNYI